MKKLHDQALTAAKKIINLWPDIHDMWGVFPEEIAAIITHAYTPLLAGLLSEVEEPLCQHLSWRVAGSNRVGYATCEGCEQEVPLPFLFNRLHDRMQAALAKAGLRER